MFFSINLSEMKHLSRILGNVIPGRKTKQTVFFRITKTDKIKTFKQRDITKRDKTILKYKKCIVRSISSPEHGNCNSLLLTFHYSGTYFGSNSTLWPAIFRGD